MGSNTNAYLIRFNPTDVELITYYIKNLILGITIPEIDRGVMIFKSLYGENATPWELFKRDDPMVPWLAVLDNLGRVSKSENVIYAFTMLSNVGKTEKSDNKQKNRVAGCGTWHGNTPQKRVPDRTGRTIGFKRTFTFRTPDVVATDGQWTMTEYSIHLAANGIANTDGMMSLEDFVLCRIKRDDSKSSQGGKIVTSKRKLGAEPLPLSDRASSAHHNKLRKGMEEEEEEEEIRIIGATETCASAMNGTRMDDADVNGGGVDAVAAANGGEHQGSSSGFVYPWEGISEEELTDPNLCFDENDALLLDLGN